MRSSSSDRSGPVTAAEWLQALRSSGQSGSRLDSELPWILKQFYRHFLNSVIGIWVVALLLSIAVAVVGDAPWWAPLSSALVCGPAALMGLMMRRFAGAPAVYALETGIHLGSKIVRWEEVLCVRQTQRLLEIVYEGPVGTRFSRRPLAGLQHRAVFHLVRGGRE